MSRADIVVDARGVLCPVPIIRLARTAATCPDGTLLALVTDDPAAAHDVPAWCRLRGHQLVATHVLHDSEIDSSSEPGSSDVLPATGPEPNVPNPDPGQALRHLIRLRGAATPTGHG